ncbi:MAG: hypothetical protein N4J56_007151 [Chroococcidiopsis sp. SAG 2025]|uniref:hypothetical protein n=1 Tax=Chroococcidiopsis sp. SAG 2025 TaxID=171389 RepID=UPI0029371816|nr:hypothetical protein [Chroococcidiopsis sp. SAG 2025]MDV2997446.1 hypothetical protein [Chroococcidiopsis sp. SAG 2025]
MAHPATYHRIESPTQTPEIAKYQEASQEIWGRPARGSNIPKVKAYVGKLPANARGIEFTTDIEPDPSTPPGYAYWSISQSGVEVRVNENGEELAILRVLSVENRQP